MIRTKRIFILICVIVALVTFSCVSRRGDETLVEHQCERFVSLRKVDSLQIAVGDYKKIAESGTPSFYKARLYGMLERFVAGEYEATLRELQDERKSVSVYPDVALLYSYYEARCLQRMRRYDMAAKAFEEIVAFNSADDAVNERASGVVCKALLQLVNSYQSAGKPVECVDFLEAFAANPTPLVRKYAWRDLLSVESYALSRTEREADAQRIVEQMLRIPLYKPDAQRRFRDYAYAAAAFYADPKRQNDVVRWCKLALQEAWRDGEISGMQWVQSMLASIYQNTGRISDAIALYEKSVDQARRFKDLSGEANAYNQMTDLYLYWGLTDFAERTAIKALAADRDSNRPLPMVSSTCYRNMGVVKSYQNQPDSAAAYFKKAEELCASLPYNSGMSDIKAAWGTMLIEQRNADSVADGMRMLADVMRNGLRSSRSRASLGLAKAYFKQGRNAEGEAMLDSLYSLLTASESPVFMRTAYTYALGHYLQTGNTDKMRRLSKLCLEEINNYYGETQMKAVANLYSRYENERTRLELQLAQSEASSRRTTLMLWIAVSLVLLLALLLSVSLYLRKRRVYEMQVRLAEQRISAVTDVLEQVSSQREEAEAKLTELVGKTENRAQISSQLPADLLSEGETKFRMRFQMLYPMFLERLREAAPEISKREELLCMLIALKLNNDQIADIVCIERKSVNMARHRLRKKFGMDKETSLDDVILSFAK